MLEYRNLKHVLHLLHRDLLLAYHIVYLNTLNLIKISFSGLPWWYRDKNVPANAEDVGLILVWGNSTCLGATKLLHHKY